MEVSKKQGAPNIDRNVLSSLTLEALKTDFRKPETLHITIDWIYHPYGTPILHSKGTPNCHWPMRSETTRVNYPETHLRGFGAAEGFGNEGLGFWV